MPANKLQHYVPRAHLRPFSLASEGKAINMLAIASATLVEGAPIRGQCSRDYFYGKDLVVEKGLQEMEGTYAAIVKKAAADPTSITSADLLTLRDAALLQSLRTYGYIEKLRAMADEHYRDLVEMTPAGTEPPDGGPMPLGVAVMMALSHYAASRAVVDDLRAVLVANESRVDFITGDDPAISINRYYAQRLRPLAFGHGSTGHMLFMPLTPRLLFAAFDPNCYGTLGRSGNVISVKRDAEIDALNELQFLHARSSIYFQDWGRRQHVSGQFDLSHERRPTEWHYRSVLERVAVDASSGAETYAKVDKIVPDKTKVYLTSLEQVHVSPSRWPAFLPYRARVVTEDTRSAAGHMRPGRKEVVEEQRRRRELSSAKAPDPA